MEPKPPNEYAQPITSMTKEEYFDYLELAVGPLLEYQKEWAWAYANSMSKEEPNEVVVDTSSDHSL